MQWFWTDDLAALLIEHGLVGPEHLIAWTSRPVAYSAAEETDGLEMARHLIGDVANTDAA
ncbi:MAG: hypothetical protein WAM81_00985 [Acidimicrobiia bacterium]